MATVKGTNKTLIDAKGSGGNVVPRGEFAGTLKCCYDTYTFTADASGEVVEVATPPKGSKIMGVQLTFANLGTGCTLAVGDINTTALYIAATSAAAAGSTQINTVAGIGYVIGTTPGDDEILVTVAGSAVDGIIETLIYYV